MNLLFQLSMKKNNFSNRESFFLLDNQGYIISSQPNKTNVGTKFEMDYYQRIMDGEKGFFHFDWHDISSILTYQTDENTNFKTVSILPMDIIQQKKLSCS